MKLKFLNVTSSPITLFCKCGIELFLDDEDLNHYQNNKFSCTRSGAVTFKKDNKTRTLGRDILTRTIGSQTNLECDHIDRDTHNNERSNLRQVTSIQNSLNRSLRITNNSGYRGVSHHKNGWQVRISVNKKEYHIGYFSTKQEAAKVYDMKAKELHGDFAQLNFSVS